MPPRNRPRNAAGQLPKVGLRQVFLCLPSDETVLGVHLRRHRHGLQVRETQIANAAEWRRLSRTLGAKCPVIAVLPKSLYLLRTLDLPIVPTQEVPPMLKLEVEAYLPPEFGPAEISYRTIQVQNDRPMRYESHVARRSDLGAFLDRLRIVGISPQVVLPSCVLWSMLLDLADGVDVLVAQLGPEQLEVASRTSEGIVNVRTLGTGGSRSEESIRRGLAEYIRSQSPRKASRPGPVSVGWLGEECPSHLANGGITFCDVKAVMSLGLDEKLPEGIAGTLRCFAAGLLATREASLLQTGNLLPYEVRARQQQQVIRNAVLLGIVLVLVACVLSGVALHVASHRHRSRIAELSARTESIRKEGERIGRQIEQLKMIRAVRTTQNDFTRVIAGLCESAPPGLSYSNVELEENGRLRLQGQAESLAVAFLLPERLEKQGPFQEAQPGDAARTRKGESTVAEFRVECRLSRKGDGR